MLQSASYTDIGGRPRNEDTAGQVRKGDSAICAVVADGLGGGKRRPRGSRPSSARPMRIS